jgi:hypothetical protein
MGESRWRYLPLDCPLCGRHRLEYDPDSQNLECERCGASAEVLNMVMEEDRKKRNKEESE